MLLVLFVNYGPFYEFCLSGEKSSSIDHAKRKTETAYHFFNNSGRENKIEKIEEEVGN